MTDDIANACYGLAGGFASVIYMPQPAPEEIKNTTALSFIYALITYGFNIYLKEHSLSTNASPYRLPQDARTIRRIQKKTLSYTSRGELVSTPLSDKIIKILTKNIKNQVKMEEFALKGYCLNKTKLLDYSKLSMYWGYNFARDLLNS